MKKLALPLGCLIFLMLSCKSKNEGVKPVEQKITESVYASGVVKSKNQYQVFSSVNGVVAQVMVTEGDKIRKGDALFRLTNTSAVLNTENARLSADYASVAANEEKLNELKINIDLAKTKMDNDASLLQRQKNLWQQQIGTRNEVDQRQLAYESSANSYEAAKLRLAELQKQVSFQARQSQKSLEIAQTVAGDFIIKSEVDGRVYSVLKEKGEMVNTQTTVALVGDSSAFTLELQVDEYDIARIRQGQKILLSLDSYKGQAFEATVTKINPLMNERSKSFMVEAAFVKQPATLFPNLTCEANIVIQEKEKAITIPRDYLLQGDYVMLANKEKKKVITGLKDYQRVEIISGLNANDLIIKPAK